MVLKGLHWAVHRLLKMQGYRFEQRRSGELRLGLWRKTLRPPSGMRGEGRAMRRFVLVPGFGDTPLSWIPVVSLLLPLLRRQCDEVVLVDFPGFRGFLASARAFHSMELLMEKLFDVLDSLKPHTLIGHSLGGWLVARYAAVCGAGQRPNRKYAGPERVILADPSGAFGNEAIRDAWAERFRKARQEGFRPIRPHVFGKEPFWFRWLAKEFHEFISAEEVVQFIDSVREEHLVEELLPNIRSKVWLIWGELDTLTPVECSKIWLDRLPPEANARILLIKGVGHSLQLESPALTAVALAQALSERAAKILDQATVRRVSRRFWLMQGPGKAL